jgi:hypothetical protein
MYVIKSERNKTLKIVDGFKFRFHKMLKNDISAGVAQLTRVSIF